MPVAKLSRAKTVKCLVVDEAGAPIQGAVVVRYPTVRPRNGTQGLTVGETSPLGLLDVPLDPQDETATEGGVAAFRDGYVADFEPLADDAGPRSDVTLTLSRGASLTVRCVDRRGRPVAGARIVVAATPLSATVAASVADTSGRVFRFERTTRVATAGADGTAVIRGLQARKWWLRADADRYVALRTHHEVDLAHGGETTRDVAFATPYVYALEVEGDRVMVARNDADPSQWESINECAQAISELRDQVIAEFPNATVLPVLPRDEGLRELPKLKIRLLLAARGLCQVEVPAVPYPSFVRPVVVRADELVPTAPCGRAEVRFRDSAGDLPEFDRYQIVATDRTSPIGSADAVGRGGRFSLPAGKYRIRLEPGLGAMDPAQREFVVVPDETVSVTPALAGRFANVKLDVRIPSDFLGTHCWVEFAPLGGRTMRLPYMGRMLEIPTLDFQRGEVRFVHDGLRREPILIDADAARREGGALLFTVRAESVDGP